MAKIVTVILQVGSLRNKEVQRLERTKKNPTDTREHWVSILCFLEVGVVEREREREYA